MRNRKRRTKGRGYGIGRKDGFITKDPHPQKGVDAGRQKMGMGWAGASKLAET